MLLAGVLLFSNTKVSVYAKTLAEAFSGGVYNVMNYYNPITNNADYSAICYAETNGYVGHHYVRAYFGDANGQYDSGRVWSYGDNYASATYWMGSSVVFGRLFRPAAYSKYGTT